MFIFVSQSLQIGIMEVLDKKTGELFESNAPFFQFRKHNFKLIRKLNEKSPTAANLFFFLVENMLESSNSVVVSQEALCEVLQVSRMTLHRAIKFLVEGKYVQILKSGVNNVYCVNADIVWTKRAGDLYHARFNTSVYLTSSEQDEEQRIKIKKTFEKIVNVEPFKKKLKDEEKAQLLEVTEEEKEAIERTFNQR
jgi:Firmicute plasmid replication protein (RepL)